MRRFLALGVLLFLTLKFSEGSNISMEKLDPTVYKNYGILGNIIEKYKRRIVEVWRVKVADPTKNVSETVDIPAENIVFDISFINMSGIAKGSARYDKEALRHNKVHITFSSNGNKNLDYLVVFLGMKINPSS